jgi:hypothetical protein
MKTNILFWDGGLSRCVRSMYVPYGSATRDFSTGLWDANWNPVEIEDRDLNNFPCCPLLGRLKDGNFEVFDSPPIHKILRGNRDWFRAHKLSGYQRVGKDWSLEERLLFLVGALDTSGLLPVYLAPYVQSEKIYLSREDSDLLGKPHEKIYRNVAKRLSLDDLVHINGQALDCRRENLAPSTGSLFCFWSTQV